LTVRTVHTYAALCIFMCRSLRPRRTIHLVFHNTAGVWRYAEPGDALDSVHAAEAAAGRAAAQFFAKVPQQWRWMFDARSLRSAFHQPDVRVRTSHTYVTEAFLP
jgi:hypothetical protein